MTTYVYIISEPNLFTVGFYDPNGKWYPESDHSCREKAAIRVSFLNGIGKYFLFKYTKDSKPETYICLISSNSFENARNTLLYNSGIQNISSVEDLTIY